MARPNPIDVVEAAYDLDVDDRTWLTNLAHGIRPLLDDGLGITAYPFDMRQPLERIFDDAISLGFDVDLLPSIAKVLDQLATITRAMHLIPDNLMTGRATLDQYAIADPKGPGVELLFGKMKCVDATALQTVEPSGRGVIFWSPLSKVRTYEARTQRLWRRVAAHVAAGRRLRAAIATGMSDVEAVVSTSGRIEHAEDVTKPRSVRDSLRDAVLAQERARGPERRTDPEGATAAWTALVDGRWSLVDRFESDGRRYLVARRNELVLPDPRALTERENVIAQLAALGKANKLIAYEMGLGISTVATHLASAMRKLGVRTRVELVDLVSRLGGGAP